MIHNTTIARRPVFSGWLTSLSSTSWLNGYGTSLILSITLACICSSCQLLGGIEVESIAQTTNKPAQVAVYLKANDGDGPVTRLEATHFRLTENDTELDPNQVQLQLLSRDSVAVHHTLVLVDMSGPIDEPGRRELLIKQLVPFVDRLRMQQDVSVYGFDGGEKLHSFGKFPKQAAKPGSAKPDSAKPGSDVDLSGILEQKQADSSSNLNGALLTAISQLDFELNASAQPIKLGRIAVIARSPDLAGRTTDERVDERLSQVDHHLFMLGVEKEPNTGFSERIGRDGHVLATSSDNMESQLAELATMLEADYGQYYLLSYCSPARSGQRILVVDVSSPQGDGSEVTGSFEVQFSADGFGSGCDASKVPRFAGAKAGAAGSKPATKAAVPAPPPETPEEAPPPADGDDEAVPPPSSPAYAE